MRSSREYEALVRSLRRPTAPTDEAPARREGTGWRWIVAGVMAAALVGMAIHLRAPQPATSAPPAPPPREVVIGPCDPPSPSLPAEELERAEAAYRTAAAWLRRKRIPAAIETLEGRLQRYPRWERLADAYNLLGRAHFYRIHSDALELSPTTRRAHLAAAERCFRKARDLYQEPGARTRFDLPVQRWMPEHRERAFWRHGCPPNRVRYRGSTTRAAEEMALWISRCRYAGQGEH